MTVSVKIADAVMRRIAPARPGRRVSAEEQAAIDPLLPRYHKFEVIFFLPVVPALIAASAAGLWWLEGMYVGPVGAPVFSERNGFLWAAGPIFFWLGLMFPGTRLLARRWWGEAYGLYDRIIESRRGINAGREHAIYASFFALVGVLMGVVCWGMGTVIDNSGLWYKASIFQAARRPYSEVRSVTLYSRIDAPVGIVDRPTFRIEFADGDHVDVPGSGHLPAFQLDGVAVFVAQQAGVTRQVGDVRPR